MENYEYIYTINPDSNEPIMLINDIIGICVDEYGYSYGVSGGQFQKELLSLDEKGKKKIKIYINSIGGSVKDGQSIFDAIINSKANVDTYCTGLCASIAGVIFLAGKNRFIADYGLLMTHSPYVEDGPTDSEYLTRTKDSLIRMICARTGVTEESVSNMMNTETWMNAEEAIEAGFATEIVNSGDSNKKRITKQTDVYAKWSECGLIMNKAFGIKNIKENMSLQKINAKLGLNEDASMESTLIEINKLLTIKNKMEEDDEDEDDEDNEAMDKMKAELKEAQDKYDACMSEMTEMKNKMAEADAQNKKQMATDMIQNFVKLGKIKNETASIEKWTNMAIADYQLAKDLIDELPLNKTAVKIQTVDNVSNSVTGKYDAVSKKMAELSNKLNIK